MVSFPGDHKVHSGISLDPIKRLPGGLEGGEEKPLIRAEVKLAEVRALSVKQRVKGLLDGVATPMRAQAVCVLQ
jgi:hypothetical protein